MPINPNPLATLLFWGALYGLLLTFICNALIATALCLHGLFQSRWKRLRNKAAPGIVKYTINVRLLLKYTCYAVSGGLLLAYFSQQYLLPAKGGDLLIFVGSACVAALPLLKNRRKKLRVIWRLSHEVDYAEKRERTRRLKG